MKNLTLTIVILVMLISCVSETEKSKRLKESRLFEITRRNDLKKLGLNGKVKQIKERSYSALSKFGTIEKGVNKRDDLSTAFKSLDFKIIDHDFDLVFDSLGFISQKKVLNSDGSIDSLIDFFYDKDKKLIEERHFNNKNIYEKWTYSFSSQNYNIEKEISIYNSEGNLKSKIVYEFQNGNNLKTINTYNSDGAIEKRIKIFPRQGRDFTEYEYHGEYEINNKDLSEIESRDFYFDKSGRLSIINYNKHPYLSRIGYDYLENKNLHQITESYLYENAIRKLLFNKYDKNENWINCLVYYNLNENPSFIIERQIDYY